jgi:hypothetical protein
LCGEDYFAGANARYSATDIQIVTIEKVTYSAKAVAGAVLKLSPARNVVTVPLKAAASLRFLSKGRERVVCHRVSTIFRREFN